MAYRNKKSNFYGALLALPLNSVCLDSVSMKTTPIVAVLRLRPDFGVCVETEIWDDVSRQIPRQRPEYRSLAFLLRLRPWMNFRGQNLEPDQSLDFVFWNRNLEWIFETENYTGPELGLCIETETWNEFPRPRTITRPELGLSIETETWHEFPRRRTIPRPKLGSSIET